jgi:hypothetical protein
MIILALTLLNICHWLADYTHLSRPWMLSAKRFGKPLPPILAHALVHSVLFTLVSLMFTHDWREVTIVFLFELLTHFLIDVLKGRLNEWFPSLQNPVNPYHWYIFGADQFLHQLIIIIICGYLFNVL